MSATITELLDERRRCTDLVLWYQNRVLRLDIALAECCEGLHRTADRESPAAPPAVAVVDIPAPHFRKSASGITYEIRQMFAEMNGHEVQSQAIYRRVSAILAPRKIEQGVFNSVLCQMCKRNEIRRVGRGVYANVKSHEMEIRRLESVARVGLVPNLAETVV